MRELNFSNTFKMSRNPQNLIPQKISNQDTTNIKFRKKNSSHKVVSIFDTHFQPISPKSFLSVLTDFTFLNMIKRSLRYSNTRREMNSVRVIENSSYRDDLYVTWKDKNLVRVMETLLSRPFHARNESLVIGTCCALVTTSGWLDAKIFKFFQNFRPIESRH